MAQDLVMIVYPKQRIKDTRICTNVHIYMYKQQLHGVIDFKKGIGIKKATDQIAWK